MRATEAGLIVGGEVDRSTEKGRQVWRQIKRGTAGFSIRYMAESRPRKAGGRELVEIDLLEISATSTPMHPSTRALSWKSAADDDVPSEADQRRRLALLTNPALIRIQEQERARMLTLLAEPDPKAIAAKYLRPVQIKSFEC